MNILSKAKSSQSWVFSTATSDFTSFEIGDRVVGVERVEEDGKLLIAFSSTDNLSSMLFYC